LHERFSITNPKKIKTILPIIDMPKLNTAGFNDFKKVGVGMKISAFVIQLSFCNLAILKR
jgi:hypothetical protein